jgi:hypothetical protein
MSQINVNNVLPLNWNAVNVNGAYTSLVVGSLRIGNANIAASGTNNTIIGSGAAANVTGAANTIIGQSAGGLLTSGQDNTFIGQTAGANTTTGFSNTYIGQSAAVNATTANGNVVVGDGAGFNISTAINSVFVGNSTGQGVSNISGDNIVLLGAAARPSVAGASGEITLGNTGITALRCAVTSITSLSDARDKKDITELRAGLDFVKGLRPVEFVWDDRDEDGKHGVSDFGFIAQELKSAQEDANLADVLKLVYESNPEKLEASYGKLVPILVKAVQELAAKVEQLEKKK